MNFSKVFSLMAFALLSFMSPMHAAEETSQKETSSLTSKIKKASKYALYIAGPSALIFYTIKITLRYLDACAQPVKAPYEPFSMIRALNDRVNVNKY